MNNYLEPFKANKAIYERLTIYFQKNTAARKYLEVCNEEGWNFVIDHLTIRTHNIDRAAQEYLSLGWTYDETLEYRAEGWWAKIYRHPNYPTMFIDQSYDDAPENLQIVKKWVDKFGDQEFHHIAVLVPGEIEETVNKLKAKGVNFPGKITGSKGTRLRQIFSAAEIINNAQYSVLELTQRGIDQEIGKLYLGFIGEQADSLMKDSTL